MKIEEIRTTIRFANEFEYTCTRPLSKTYDSRLIYIIDGAGKITVGTGEVEIQKGLLIAFQGGISYKFKPENSFLAYAVDFDLTDGYSCDGFILPVSAAEFDETELHKPAEFEDSEFLAEPFIGQVGVQVGEELRRLIEEYNSGKLFSKRRAEMMLGCVFLGLARSLTYRSKGMQISERVLDYIGEHYNEPIKNKMIAEAFGYEPCYLNRTVKQSTGSSIHRHLNKKRVDEGIKLLLTTGLTLEKIAERVGFSSAAHFLKVCKDITGRNPSFFRK